MEQQQMGNNVPQEEEIDLVEVVKKLWKNRKLIIKVTVVAMVLGIFVALFSATEYTANCTLVPQVGEEKASGGLSGLAAMAGINLNVGGSGGVLSPTMFPRVLSSVPFQKEMMQMPLTIEGVEHPVTLFDYYTKEEYQKFNLLSAIKKYTIGLPGVIIGAIRGEGDTTQVGKGISSIQSLSPDEKKVSEALGQIISLSVNDKDGYVELSASMPEALASAEVAQYAQNLLQRYITEFKIEKVASNLEFIQQRYDEAKAECDAKQLELAQFVDANRNVISAKAQIQEEKLRAEYTMANSVFTELAKQLEQAKIAVKETTPIFTVVDPVVIPTERSKPKRALICVLFTFLGIFAGVGTVLGLPFVANVFEKEEWKRFIKE